MRKISTILPSNSDFVNIFPANIARRSFKSNDKKTSSLLSGRMVDTMEQVINRSGAMNTGRINSQSMTKSTSFDNLKGRGLPPFALFRGPIGGRARGSKKFSGYKSVQNKKKNKKKKS